MRRFDSSVLLGAISCCFNRRLEDCLLGIFYRGENIFRDFFKEVFEGQTTWRGTVEVFDLIGHPKAKRAYAWSYRDGNQNKTVAVLEIPPIDSPESAVKAAIGG